MNRSIFQIGRNTIFNCIFLILFSIFIFFIINVENNCRCFSIRGFNTNYLRDFSYNNIKFRCSKDILDFETKLGVDLFFNNYQNHKLNFGVCKYFELRNGVYVPFKKYSCYAHPNLYLGYYNNLYFNFQFTHFNHNNSFDFFSDIDIINSRKNQFISKQIYIYKGDLFQQYLNLQDLKKNNYNIYENNNPIEIQNYLNLYNNDFNTKINSIKPFFLNK